MKQKPKLSNLLNLVKKFQRTNRQKFLADLQATPAIAYLRANAVIPLATQQVIGAPFGRAVTPLVEKLISCFLTRRLQGLKYAKADNSCQ